MEMEMESVNTHSTLTWNETGIEYEYYTDIDFQFEYDQQKLYKTVSFIFSLITLFFAVTGIFSNSISVYLYTRPTMRTSMNILLAGLSGFDLIFSILSIPTFVSPPMCIYKPHEWSFLCHVTTFSTLYIYPFTNMAKTGGIWTLVYITVQRWLIVRRPIRPARGSSLSFSNKALLIIFILSLIYNIPRFFEHKLNKEKQHIFVEESLRQNPVYMSLYYSVLYLLTHFIIPFVLLAFINGTMACTIRRALKQHRMLSHSEKAAAMMATVVLLFFSCNTLPFVLNFVEFMDRDLWTRVNTKICLWSLNDLSNILLLINATLNSFIYYFSNQKYARILRKYLADWFQYTKTRFNYPGDPIRYRSPSYLLKRPKRTNRTPEIPFYAIYTCKPTRRPLYPYDWKMYNGSFLERDDMLNGLIPIETSGECKLMIPNRYGHRDRSKTVSALVCTSNGRFRAGGRTLSTVALTTGECGNGHRLGTRFCYGSSSL